MAETYFYKRKDGYIFACEAKEAEVIHNIYEQIGVSSGELYELEVAKARSENIELLAMIKEIEEDIEEMDDIDSRLALKRKLKPLKKEWQELVGAASKEGFNKELEAARGNFKIPKDTSRTELVGNTNSLIEKEWTETKK